MLFTQFLIAILAGISCGIITGLTPGIHINLVITFLIASSAFFLIYASPITLCVFIVSLSMTHQFLEFIPSIFLGAPNPGTALSVLPGHRYLLKGNGLMAIRLAIIGCFFGLLLATLLLYPLLIITPIIFPFIQEYMAFFLIAIIMSMIMQNKRKTWAVFVLCIAGLAGILTFSIPNVQEPLFPLLSGLFGTSTLIMSLNESNFIPKQKVYNYTDIEKKVVYKAVGAGQISALAMSLFPGMSPAIAAVFGMQLTKKIGDHGYMILQGCINAAGFLVSIATLFAINKARNGSIVGVQKLIQSISAVEIMILICVSLITAALVVPVTLEVGKKSAALLNKVNYKLLIYFVLAVITILAWIMSGFIGLLILITTTAIGIIPAIVKVTRTQAMGCLLIPVLLYYVI